MHACKGQSCNGWSTVAATGKCFFSSSILDLNKRPWLQRCKCFFQTRHKRKESLKLYGVRHQDDNGNGKSRNILLVRKVSINRDECLELCSGRRPPARP
jgi:hypothetical protein